MSFQTTSFCENGIFWPQTNTSASQPIFLDDFIIFREWAEKKLRTGIKKRSLIALMIGESRHDQHLQAICPDASVQIVLGSKSFAPGWDSWIRLGKSVILPFKISSEKIAFVWIEEIQTKNGSFTTGYRVSFAKKHPEKKLFIEKKQNFTLADFCDSNPDFIPQHMKQNTSV